MDKATSQGRRAFLFRAGKAGLAAALLPSLTSSFAAPAGRYGGAEEIPYTQQPLPYGYGALEPVIDGQTMEIHYSRHGAAYAKNLGEAVAAEKVDTSAISLTKLLSGISNYSVKMRNNGGGHYNHEFFWHSMQAPKDGNQPGGQLLEDIEYRFGSFAAFQAEFSDAAKNRFGSGWAWLVMTPSGGLQVGSTPNQDNPLMNVSELRGIPLLGLDVWEHAYYLKYQNRRADYISGWWRLVNWDVVAARSSGA